MSEDNKEKAGADQPSGGKSEENEALNKLIIVDEIIELLTREDISEAIKTFNAETDEMQTALEFVNSHIQFITELVENDYNKKIIRRDVEIKDLVANVNLMLKGRDELLFTTMVLKSPLHYRYIQAHVYKQADIENESEENNNGDSAVEETKDA